MSHKRVSIVPPSLTEAHGGPGSFYQKLKRGLEARGIGVANGFDDEPYDAILVINGTRHLAKLWQRKRRGIRIVQRLANPNWLHRYLPVGIRGYLLAEIRNLDLRLIRSFLADHIVYQSDFARDRWDTKHGVTKVPSTIIYNGTDLALFDVQGSEYESQADVCILSVEGTQGADPFGIAVRVAQGIKDQGVDVELLMFGTPFKDASSQLARYPFVKFKGAVPNSALPFYYRGSTLFLSTDILTAGCPNSVIEALSCGAPVLGYKAGVLPEILSEMGGHCVEYGGDPWKAEPPDNTEGMVKAAMGIAVNRDRYHVGARTLAEDKYGLDQMVDAYIEVLLGDGKG